MLRHYHIVGKTLMMIHGLRLLKLDIAAGSGQFVLIEMEILPVRVLLFKLSFAFLFVLQNVRVI
jgi:hypothetical protein